MTAMGDLTDRLRGLYANGGGGTTDRKMEYTRTFKTPSIQHEAANRIGYLTAERDALAKRVRELEGVVEKLPKTADGVPVFPGDIVWHTKNPSSDEITSFAVSDYLDWKPSVWDGKTEARCVNDKGGGWPVRSCYSTHQAAEAARGKGVG